MDTSSMAVFLTEICGPIRARDGAMLTWSDNCPSHCTKAIDDLYIEKDIYDAKYPFNCTDILQPMDVTVNAGVKQHIRHNNAQAIVEHLQQHNINCTNELDKPEEERKHTKFRPPKPTVHKAMTQFNNLVKTHFATPKYKQALQRTFEATGSYYEDPEARTFHTFSSVGNKVQGKVKIIPSNAQPADLPKRVKVTTQSDEEQQDTEDTTEMDADSQLAGVLESILDDLEDGLLFVDPEDVDSSDSEDESSDEDEEDDDDDF
jgi:hypothetical protein